MVVSAGVVKLAEIAPTTGSVVTPELPRYHWKPAESPEAVTARVAVPPLLMVVDAGWVVMTGPAMPATVTVAVLESEDPAVLETRTQ